MSVTTPSAPARASARQSARPRPREPPVTRATFPLRSIMLARLPDLGLRFFARQWTPLAGNRSRDHEPLNLGGPLPDLVDLGVAHPFLDGILADVAVPAENLNGVDRDLHRHVGGKRLRHAAIGAREEHIVLRHPARARGGK